MAVVGQYACLVHLLSLYKTSSPVMRQYAALKPRPHNLLTHINHFTVSTPISNMNINITACFDFYKSFSSAYYNSNI
jgi:hypothetical protein